LPWPPDWPEAGDEIGAQNFEPFAREALARYAAVSAVRIERGLERGRAIIAFPRSLYLLARLTRILPARLVDKVMARFHVNVPVTQERIQ
jgi:hypothetical protein